MAYFLSDLENADSPWPRLGEKLLDAAPDVRGAAFLGGLEGEGTSAIADGYLEAADMLASAWLDGQAGRATSCAAAARALPILSHYRHGLELTLKALLSDYSGLDEVEISAFGHDLESLWGKCRALLWPYDEVPGDDLLAVEQAIKEFHTFDPRNDALRYSFDRRGVTISRRIRSLDVLQLRDRMRAVANFFDCAESELHLRMHGW